MKPRRWVCDWGGVVVVVVVAVPRLSFKSALDASSIPFSTGSKAKPAPSSLQPVRLQNMPQFCHNLKNLSSPIDRFEPGESVCVDIAIPRLFACAESECSICSAIQSGVKISENGWIAENRMNRQSWARPLGKPMRVYGEWTAQKGSRVPYVCRYIRVNRAD